MNLSAYSSRNLELLIVENRVVCSYMDVQELPHPRKRKGIINEESDDDVSFANNYVQGMLVGLMLTADYRVLLAAECHR